MLRGIGKLILMTALIAPRLLLAEGVGGALSGAADIINAGAPIAIAGIQAASDVSIARINSVTSIAVTQIEADTSKYLANTQAQVALANAEAAKKINEINQDGQTERLGMQLAELRAAREDAMESMREKRMIEMEFQRQQIALAWQQAQANYDLALAKLEAEKVKAGIVQGFTSMDSSAGLVATPMSATMAQAPVGKGPLSAPGTVPVNAQLAGAMPVNMSYSGIGAAPRSPTSQRLLASLVGKTAARRTAKRGPQLVSVLDSLASGSTPEGKLKASDLSSFRAAVTVAEADTRPHRSQLRQVNLSEGPSVAIDAPEISRGIGGGQGHSGK